MKSSPPIVIAPPDALLTKCLFVKPPAVNAVDMTKAYNAQTINLGKCDKKLKALREWKQKQLEIYK